jgi:hypothetical protein
VAPVVCLLIWDDITPSLLIKFIVSAYQQEKTILPSGSKEHPLIIPDETQELLVSFDEKQNELTEYQTNVVNIRKYASDLQTYLAVKQIEKEVKTHDTCLQSLVKSHILNQTKLSCKIDNGLKTIATNIQRFGEIV